jgi:hypothetical protein
MNGFSFSTFECLETEFLYQETQDGDIGPGACWRNGVNVSSTAPVVVVAWNDKQGWVGCANPPWDKTQPKVTKKDLLKTLGQQLSFGRNLAKGKITWVVVVQCENAIVV